MRERKYLLLAVLLGLGALGMLLQRQGRLSAPEDLALRVWAPVHGSVSGAVRPIGDFVAGLVEIGVQHAENERLQNENSALKAEIVRLGNVELENRTLHSQLGFKVTQPAFVLLPAEVVGRDPSNLLQSLTLNRGSDEQIKVGSVVVSSGMLVGRVTRVGSNWAKVKLITDPTSVVNARVMAPASQAAGVLVGQPGGPLLLRSVPQGEKLETGMLVVTSGLGGTFPKGLPIGHITKVQQNDVDMFQEGEVKAEVDLGSLDMVFAIMNFEPLDLSKVAEEGRY